MKKSINRKGIFSKKVSDICIGSLSALVILSLYGCDDKQDEQTLQQNPLEQHNIEEKNGYIVVIEEQQDGRYLIQEEASGTRDVLIVKSQNGEIKKYVDNELVAVQSNQTNHMNEILAASAIGAATGMLLNGMTSETLNNRQYYKSDSVYNRTLKDEEEKKRERVYGSSGSGGAAYYRPLATSTSGYSSGYSSRSGSTGTSLSSTSSPRSSGYFASTSSAHSTGAHGGSSGG